MFSYGFWATVCQTVRSVLSDRCRSLCPDCPVCNVGVLWPNGWMDQAETWHAGRTRPGLHCVRWKPSSPSPKVAEPPQLSAHICCGQMAGWIQMPFDTEAGLGPDYIVLDGDPAPPPQKGGGAPNFRPMSIVAKGLDGSRCYLVRR